MLGPDTVIKLKHFKLISEVTLQLQLFASSYAWEYISKKTYDRFHRYMIDGI